MRESKIEALFKKAVEELNGKAYKFVSPGNAGVADRVVVLPGGRVCFVELKRKNGVLTPLQCHFSNEVTDRNVAYHVIRCVEDIENWVYLYE